MEYSESGSALRHHRLDLATDPLGLSVYIVFSAPASGDHPLSTHCTHYLIMIRWADNYVGNGDSLQALNICHRHSKGNVMLCSFKGYWDSVAVGIASLILQALIA